MNSSPEEKAKQAKFCFQYFDEASEVGVENEKGERIRKRKRPGRKPNPPSQQERREQNRLAQRNFREREQQRRQEREKQWKEYIDELTNLRRRLAIAEYEGNYLRGWILQLLLASIAQHGTVPQAWVDTRMHPIPHPTMVPIPLSPNTDKCMQLPPMLQLVLNDQKRTIVELKEALEMADTASPSCPLVRRAHHARFRQQQYRQQQQLESQETITDTFVALPPSAVTPCQYKSIQELLSTDIVSLNTDSQDVRRTFPDWTPNHQQQNLPTQSSSSPTSHHRKASVPHPLSNLSTTSDINNGDIGVSSSDSGTRQKSTKTATKQHRSSPPLSSAFSPLSHRDSDGEKHSQRQISPSITLPEVSTPQSSSPATSPPLDSTSIRVISSLKVPQPVKSTTFKIPTLKRPDDLSHMPTTQALHIMRLQLKIGSLIGDKIQYALTPTALQRIIPHDVRIDYVPAGSIRDRMIVFQDFYDIDDCFQLFCSNSVFVGGDIRDARNWVLDPCVTEKYWFFSHHLFDHHFDDCHIPEEFIEDLREWSIQQQQQHEQQEQQKQQQQQQPTPTSESHDDDITDNYLNTDCPTTPVPNSSTLPTSS
ncbi:unnamed protein product [Absidia cylindrospora]